MKRRQVDASYRCVSALWRTRPATLALRGPLNDAAAVGAPVLLRNATALWDHDTDREPEVVSTSRLDELTTAARRFTPQSASSHIRLQPLQPGQAAEGEPSTWLPVSLIFSNGTTNRMHTLSVEGSTARRMRGKVAAAVVATATVAAAMSVVESRHRCHRMFASTWRRRGVDGALQRPLTQYMDVRSLSSLRSGSLSRCVKQVNPSLIIHNPNGRVPAALAT